MRNWQRAEHRIEFAKFAVRCVENARAANERVFARFAAEPVIISSAAPQCDRRQKELLARIAPWLPKKIPHWMRPV